MPIENSVFLEACNNEDLKTVKKFLKSSKRPALGQITDQTGRTAMHYAVKSVELLRVLAEHVEVAPQLNSKNSTNSTSGANGSDSEAARSLIDQADHVGNTPLHIAVMNSINESARVLIEELHADVDAADLAGHRAVNWAIFRANPAGLKLLIEHSAQLDYADGMGVHPLHYASQNVDARSLDMLRQLLDVAAAAAMAQTAASEHEARTIAAVDIECRDWLQRTPLIYAASANNEFGMRELLRRQARLDAVDNNRLSALHCAADNGFTRLFEVIKEFVDDSASGHTVDWNMRDKSGCTALMYATKSNHLSVVQFLVQSAPAPAATAAQPVNFNCAPTTTTTGEATSDAGAVGAVGGGVPRLALDIDVNAKDLLGRTACHFAADLGHIDCLHELVRAGADVWLCADESSGNYPLHEAVYKGHVDAVRLLIDWAHSASVGRADDDNTDYVVTLLTRANNALQLPIHLAAIENHADVCRVLLEHGAQPNHAFVCADGSRKTALDLVSSPVHSECGQILQQYGGKTFAELQAAGEAEPVDSVSVSEDATTSKTTELDDDDDEVDDGADDDNADENNDYEEEDEEGTTKIEENTQKDSETSDEEAGEFMTVQRKQGHKETEVSTEVPSFDEKFSEEAQLNSEQEIHALSKSKSESKHDKSEDDTSTASKSSAAEPLTTVTATHTETTTSENGSTAVETTIKKDETNEETEKSVEIEKLENEQGDAKEKAFVNKETSSESTTETETETNTTQTITEAETVKLNKLDETSKSEKDLSVNADEIQKRGTENQSSNSPVLTVKKANNEPIEIETPATQIDRDSSETETIESSGETETKSDSQTKTSEEIVQVNKDERKNSVPQKSDSESDSDKTFMMETTTKNEASIVIKKDEETRETEAERNLSLRNQSEIEGETFSAANDEIIEEDREQRDAGELQVEEHTFLTRNRDQTYSSDEEISNKQENNIIDRVGEPVIVKEEKKMKFNDAEPSKEVIVTDEIIVATQDKCETNGETNDSKLIRKDSNNSRRSSRISERSSSSTGKLSQSDTHQNTGEVQTQHGKLENRDEVSDATKSAQKDGESEDDDHTLSIDNSISKDTTEKDNEKSHTKEELTQIDLSQMHSASSNKSESSAMKTTDRDTSSVQPDSVQRKILTCRANIHNKLTVSEQIISRVQRSVADFEYSRMMVQLLRDYKRVEMQKTAATKEQLTARSVWACPRIAENSPTRNRTDKSPSRGKISSSSSAQNSNKNRNSQSIRPKTAGGPNKKSV